MLRAYVYASEVLIEMLFVLEVTDLYYKTAVADWRCFEDSATYVV